MPQLTSSYWPLDPTGEVVDSTVGQLLRMPWQRRPTAPPVRRRPRPCGPATGRTIILDTVTRRQPPNRGSARSIEVVG